MSCVRHKKLKMSSLWTRGFEICLMKLDSENSALSSLLIGYLHGDWGRIASHVAGKSKRSKLHI